ncbi:hypothetical protein [Haloterrigena gelatinilytica]|uniref:hypothetical protein n=1 Tax=Haloterrigena gelatinilytica TaxID=2741724 RepID=UPI0020C664B8|nr:hypothetical protein [Haloterrigena gelatinilytica]
MSVTRDAILDCIGTIPDRPDPAVETVSTTAADGFERRLVEYDVEPGSESVRTCSSPTTLMPMTSTPASSPSTLMRVSLPSVSPIRPG